MPGARARLCTDGPNRRFRALPPRIQTARRVLTYIEDEIPGQTTSVANKQPPRVMLRENLDYRQASFAEGDPHKVNARNFSWQQHERWTPSPRKSSRRAALGVADDIRNSATKQTTISR